MRIKDDFARPGTKPAQVGKQTKHPQKLIYPQSINNLIR